MPSIKATLNLADLACQLGGAVEASANTTPLMRSIAGILAKGVEDAFETESDPATGAKWKPLTRQYAEQRAAKGKAGKMLQLSGSLAANISREYTADYARVGSNKAYAAIHQFGGVTRPHVIKARRKKSLYIPGIGLRRSVNHPGSVVPARPYLGISPRRKQEIFAAVARHFIRAVAKNAV